MENFGSGINSRIRNTACMACMAGEHICSRESVGLSLPARSVVDQDPDLAGSVLIFLPVLSKILKIMTPVTYDVVD
jgi:hypothetical protein